MQLITELLKHSETPLSLDALITALNSKTPPCIFIKNEHSDYAYANDHFIQLMGLQTLNQLKRFNDFDLSTHKKNAQIYREHDHHVLSHQQKLPVKEVIYPSQNQPLVKMMEGTLYPIFTQKNQSNYILGIVFPESKLLFLDFNTLFKLTQYELDILLIQKRYNLQLRTGNVSLSKMEICTLIQLFKQGHAGDMAKALNLKQSTIESYLASIKNKLGVNTKTELMTCVIDNNLFEQVMV